MGSIMQSRLTGLAKRLSQQPAFEKYSPQPYPEPAFSIG
jgi:hypothetical protein